MREQTVWIYETGPLDYWTGWTLLYNALESVKNNDYEEWTDLESEAKIAKKLIERYTSWEGDGWWYVSGLPFESTNTSEPLFDAITNVV